MTGSSGRSSLIGVAISLVGNILISLALNCQKLAHVRLEQQGKDVEQVKPQTSHDEESRTLLNRSDTTGSSRKYGSDVTQSPPHTKQTAKNNNSGGSQHVGSEDEEGHQEGMSTTFLRSRLWWLGISLMTLGEFGNFLSYGFAPASLVAPLGAVALLANVIFSPLILGERFYLSDIGGILLAIVGAVTVVFSSKQSDATLNPEELWHALCRKSFIAYVITSVTLAALLAWGSTTVHGQRWILLDVGVCAVLGGFTVLSTKGLSSLLAQGQLFDLLQYPITYGLIIVLAGTALAQITYLNRALQRFDSREVIPTQFVMFTISAIVGSAILYQDFADMDAHRLINFLFGCMTTFAGVYFLTRHKEDEESNGDDGDIPVGDEDGEATEDLEHSAATNGEERLLRPATASKAARPMAVGGKASRGFRAVTTGSVPTIANLQGHSTNVLTTLHPANGSLPSTSGSVPKYIVTRRSIFNPAFPVAFIESRDNRR
ncbi:hypothetical protein CBS101457_002442 [Exobasidium rhododendri]|nr:hypothetical protein CBS101457_002442 [Exobasidium rhododendri]